MTALRVAVVGGGWAGIAAAVHARRLGHEVSLFEMSRQLGGRARGVDVGGYRLDNGQHILIGAYAATLELMDILGVDAATQLCRLPLRLQYPDGHGLCLPGGAPIPSFIRGVLACRHWRRRDRLALLWTASMWALRGFRCDARATVAQLCSRLPAAVRTQLIEPLCVAALNTAAHEASASVFLRVLHDALFGGAGSADLLLPRGSLETLVPAPAMRWFQARNVALQLGRRVTAIDADGAGWRIGDQGFDRLILACTPNEAARLSAATAPQWSAAAHRLRYEPIVTVYLACAGARLATPMTALQADARAPAQFAFDLGALGGPEGLFSFVVSGAREAVSRGLEATARATLAQAIAAFPAGTWPQPPHLVHVAAEKRATFRCTPGLRRAPARVADGLLAAGDFVEGPYPATLEGAVRSGRQAAQMLVAAGA